jgi:hypothetical protein
MKWKKKKRGGKLLTSFKFLTSPTTFVVLAVIPVAA